MRSQWPERMDKRKSEVPLNLFLTPSLQPLINVPSKRGLIRRDDTADLCDTVSWK
jgi:hypothetical protein